MRFSRFFERLWRIIGVVEDRNAKMKDFLQREKKVVSSTTHEFYIKL